jgi:transcriptional regulator
MKETDMLIHPWDAALDSAEWQDWLATTDRFGITMSSLPLTTRPHVFLPFVLPGEQLRDPGR